MEEKIYMKIDFANLQLQYQIYKKEIDSNIQAVLNNSNYILGEEVEIFEKNLQNFTGAKYAISCSSGTDALLLALLAIDIKPGDEVITTPFTWVSTSEMIALLKAKPVFIDIDPGTYNIDTNLIEAAITKKTRAIMPVSLYGQPADLEHIQVIAKKYNLKVIIDGAQSFGSTYNDKTESNFADISITSFFPSKPLGCYGDGGAIFTNNNKYAEKIKILRVHGQNERNYHRYIGICGRMDTIQATILNAKLPFFSDELEKRKNAAKQYSSGLKNLLQTPIIKPNRTSSWAQYTVKFENRDYLKSELKKKNIPTLVFYPIPLHLQACFKYLNYFEGDLPIAETISKKVLSLPINAFITKEQIHYVIKSIQEIIN